MRRPTNDDAERWNAVSSTNQLAAIHDRADARLIAWEYVVGLALTTDLITRDRKGFTLPIGLRSEVIAWFTRYLYELEFVSIQTMLLARDAFCSPRRTRDLSRLLLPASQQSGRNGPPQEDWEALREMLTS